MPHHLGASVPWGATGCSPQLIRYGLVPSLVTSVFLVVGVYSSPVPMAPEYQAVMRVSSAFVLVAALGDGFSGRCGLHRVVTFTMLQNVAADAALWRGGTGGAVLGQLMDPGVCLTVPVAITAIVALWLLERAFPNEEHVEVLPSEDSRRRLSVPSWSFSSA